MRNHPPGITRKINLQPVVKIPFSSPSNLPGLAGGGSAGFVDYERTVFEHTMELSVTGYLPGALERSETQHHFASPADQAAFSAALEAKLKAIAEDGILCEPFFDYVIMARKAKKTDALMAWRQYRMIHCIICLWISYLALTLLKEVVSKGSILYESADA